MVCPDHRCREDDVDEAVDPVLISAREAERLRGELAIDAAGIGTFDWDLVSGRLDWDDRLIEIFGFNPGTFDSTIYGFNDRLHPDDLARVTADLQTAIDTGNDFASVYRIILPSGDTRWISARGRRLCNPDGQPVRLLGAAYDITDQRDAELSVTRVLEAMPAGFYSLDRQWRFTYVNAAAEKILLRGRDKLLGQVIWTEFPAAAGSIFEDSYRRAVDTGQPVSFPAYYPPPLDGWYELHAWPSPDGLSVYFLDVTDRHHDQQQAEAAAARQALQVAVTEQLTGTMQTDRAVALLARLVVPALADFSIVTLVDDTFTPGSRRGVRDVGLWHRDEAARSVLDAYGQVRIPSLQDQAFALRALSSGQPVVINHDATSAIRGVLVEGPAQDLIAELAPESFITLPLRGRGHTVGLLTLFNGPARGTVSPLDLASATEVAARAGLALDNARLYGQQRALAEQLQHSFLSAPPEPDHGQIVVRYLPATAAAAVGGDWYDAFMQPDGATMLVIGDVAGHDTAAAATMGQLRSMLRGIAASDDHAGPAQVLHRVDKAMAQLEMGTLATAVVARLEQNLDERERGVTRLRWSNAGHLPPLVIHPDGNVAPIPDWRAEMLLGVDQGSPRTDTVTVLERGATVLLYTDGLVERRDSDLDTGIERLRAAVAELAHLPLQELCDAILQRLVNGRPDDDVALVAIRLHRQDQPRPAEAGPRRLPDPVPDEPSP
ncbi:SpoIIE family protein phosphatase [Modestobacter muralis]|uniref:protein-serine/threonine phosphatase n=1 Tax=Modestobacter muralis TaxID=1608614 RepID=A0A6P0HDU3_9ACTN|nr:SpoIIE family protein phosphatase [Modestobacter muralis]NEK96379.1 SpoIIE family protein phosphatase [Modestobacter muralis]NEN53279.1 SpoIIE family protein phosphatase [Modestobacter muralis]